MALPSTAVPLDNSQSQSSGLPSTAVPLNSQPTDSGLSSMPTQTTQADLDELNTPTDQTTAQPQDPLNIGDHAALSFMDNPQDQQAYLQKKYPYVIPDGKGGFMVGQSPGTVQPVDPRSSGNTFFSWLASQANVVPSMVGMTIGSVAGVPGAAAGAAAGEAVSKAIGSGLGANETPQKMAVDTALSGAFGAIGQAAAQKFGMVANRVIAPKLAQAVDNKISQMVNRGDDPGKFINFVASAMHFSSGAPKEDVAALMRYGVNKSLNDRTVNNPNAIINITQDIMNKVQSAKTALGTAVGASGMKLINKAGNVQIQSSPIFDYVKQELSAHPGWGTVNGDILTINNNVANSADSTKFKELLKSLGAQEIRSSYQAPQSSELLRHASDVAKASQYDINNPTHQGFIEKVLGQPKGTIASELEKSATARQDFSVSGPKSFKIPVNGNLSVKQAIGTQQIFGQLTDREKSPLSDDMRRVFTNILYRDGNGNDSPLVGQLSKVAKANGVDEWIANKDAYKNLMKSIDGVSSLGLDVASPKSIQDFGHNINKKMPVDKSIMSNLENQVGSPVFDKLKQWSAIDSLKNHDPNFLRLGMIASMIGGGAGPGDIGEHLKRGFEYGAIAGVGAPAFKTLPLRMFEGIGPKGVTGGIANAVGSQFTRQGATSAISQEALNALKGLFPTKKSK